MDVLERIGLSATGTSAALRLHGRWDPEAPVATISPMPDTKQVLNQYLLHDWQHHFNLCLGPKTPASFEDMKVPLQQMGQGQREVEPLGVCASFSGHATDVQK